MRAGSGGMLSIIRALRLKYFSMTEVYESCRRAGNAMFSELPALAGSSADSRPWAPCETDVGFGRCSGCVVETAAAARFTALAGCNHCADHVSFEPRLYGMLRLSFEPKLYVMLRLSLEPELYEMLRRSFEPELYVMLRLSFERELYVMLRWSFEPELHVILRLSLEPGLYVMLRL